MEVDYEKMGTRIRQLRKAQGWSQEELAKKCGISMSFLGHIERGTRIMSLETFASIGKALGVGTDELLWGMVHPSNSLLNIWEMSDQESQNQKDSYAMYIRIMKSVAEIMNEA